MFKNVQPSAVLSTTDAIRPVYTTAVFRYGTNKNGTGAKKEESPRINFKV